MWLCGAIGRFRAPNSISASEQNCPILSSVQPEWGLCTDITPGRERNQNLIYWLRPSQSTETRRLCVRMRRASPTAPLHPRELGTIPGDAANRLPYDIISYLRLLNCASFCCRLVDGTAFSCPCEMCLRENCKLIWLRSTLLVDQSFSMTPSSMVTADIPYISRDMSQLVASTLNVKSG